MFRLLPAIPFSAAITIAVFMIMTALVTNSAAMPANERPRATLGFLPELEERAVNVIEDTAIERIPKPPVAPNRSLTPNTADPIGVSMPATVPAAYQREAFALRSASDSPLVSVLKGRPQYPTIARDRHLEGFVDVEFSVMTDGSVADVRVIRSSHRIFERNAIAATLRFRYRPRIVDGQPQVVHGVRNRFRFQLGGD